MSVRPKPLFRLLSAPFLLAGMGIVWLFSLLFFLAFVVVDNFPRLMHKHYRPG